jgi:hypothetical protein
MLEKQFELLSRTLMTNLLLTMCLSFGALICSCVALRSLTVGGWGWIRGLLMILLLLLGMVGLIFVAHQV